MPRWRRKHPDEDVIAFDHVFTDGHLGGQQADVADIVLGARIGAARHVDIERLIERHPVGKIIGNRQGVALRVGGGILATGTAGASDQAGADVGGRPMEPRLFDRPLHVDNLGGGNVADQQILPDSPADGAAAKALGNVGQGPHLSDLHPSDRQHDADVTLPLLPLGVEADVGQPGDRAARLAAVQRKLLERELKVLLRFFRVFFQTEPVEYVLSVAPSCGQCDRHVR